MTPLSTWLVLGPMALVCYGAVVYVTCKALGARSEDYPPVRRRRRSNMALTAGPYSNPRKVP